MTVPAVKAQVVSDPRPGAGFVLELDGPPRGMHRPRVDMRGQRPHVHTEKADEQAMNDIGNAWLDAGSPRLEGPLAISVVMEVARPKGHYRGGRREDGVLSPTGERAVFPAGKKPDVDNAAKLIMDALNGRAYRDDSDVIMLRVERRWSASGWERTRVAVRTVVA
jgi:Holliday junction resolvase RusA-like endonuclease